MSWRACAARAPVTAGAQWPRHVTAQPWTKWIWRLPVWSVSQEPSPFTKTISGRSVMSMRLAKSNACSDTVGITIHHLHEALRIGGHAEAELLIESVGVAGEERPASQPLQLGMRHDGGHQALPHSMTASRLESEDVTDVGEGGTVADHAGKADLAGALEGAEAQRVLDGAGHRLARHALRPVRRGEKAVDHVEVEP